MNTSLPKLAATLLAMAVAFSLTACGTQSPDEPTAPSAPVASIEPTAPAPGTAAPEQPGKIRELPPGTTTTDVAAGVRAAFPTWPEMTNEELAAALNAGCDGLDRAGIPDDGVQGIQSHGVSQIDAAFGLLAAISSYCPEYSHLLGQ